MVTQYRLQDPIHSEKQTTTGWLCCKSGPVTVRLRTDHTGYVPGEYITAKTELDNQTGAVNLHDCSLEFRMVSLSKTNCKF